MAKFNMSKVFNKKTLEVAGKVAKKGCELAAYGLMTMLSCVTVKDVVDAIRYSGDVGYSDAVNAIMNSSMYSHDKTSAVSALIRDDSSETYKAVIQIARSGMYSHEKVKSIQNVCAIEQ